MGDSRTSDSKPKFTLLDGLRAPKKPKPAHYVPMLAYVAGTLELDAVMFADALGKGVFSNLFGHDPISIGWNGINAGSNIANIISLCRDETYHPQKGLMIALNFISGLNLLTLTDSFHQGPFFGVAKMGCGSMLASPAFAFAMFCDFIAAAIDLYYSTEQGYLEWLLGEAELNDKKLKKMEEKFFTNEVPVLLILEDTTVFDTRTQSYEGHEKNKEEYQNLLIKQESLLFDIECQLKYYSELNSKTKKIPISSSKIEDGKNRIKNILANNKRYTIYTSKQSDIDCMYQNRHADIEAERKKRHCHNIWNLKIKAASFSGSFLRALPNILLLAGSTIVIPYINIISLCLLSLVALIYIYQLWQLEQVPVPAEEEVLPERVPTALISGSKSHSNEPLSSGTSSHQSGEQFWKSTPVSPPAIPDVVPEEENERSRPPSPAATPRFVQEINSHKFEL